MQVEARVFSKKYSTAVLLYITFNMPDPIAVGHFGTLLLYNLLFSVMCLLLSPTLLLTQHSHDYGMDS